MSSDRSNPVSDVALTARPRISVVTANYNYGHLLADTIRSVLAQGYEDVEYIVVDDGSTDNSLAVARSFDGVRVVAKSNGGQVSAMMAAMPYVTGDLTVFLDSDDQLYPDACSQIARLYRPNTTLYQFALDIVDTTGERIGGYPDAPLLSNGQREFVVRHGYFSSSPTSGNAFATSHVRRMLDRAGNDLRYFIDGYLIYSAPFFGDIATSEIVIGSYLVHGANLSLSAGVTARSAEKSLRNALWQRNGIVEALRLSGSPAGTAADYLTAWYLRYVLVLRRCYGVRDIAPALSDAQVAWRAAVKFAIYPGIALKQRVQNIVLLLLLLLGNRGLGRRIVPPAP